MLIILGRPTNAINADIVKLNSNKTIPSAGDKVTVIGWGDTVASDLILSLSSVLRAVELNAISNSACRQSKGLHEGFFDSFEGSVKKNMMCAQDFNQGIVTWFVFQRILSFICLSRLWTSFDRQRRLSRRLGYEINARKSVSIGLNEISIISHHRLAVFCPKEGHS